MEPDNVVGYVLLSNIYAGAGNRLLCENSEHRERKKDLKKQPGCTWIEVNMRHTASSRSKTKVLSDSCTLNNDFYYFSYVACCRRMGDDNTCVMELAAGGWTGCYCVEHSLL